MEIISLYEHPQIATTVTCTCGRGWAVKGLLSGSYLFRQKLQADGWSIAPSDNELFITVDGIQCPVCNGRQTAQEYKEGNPVRPPGS
jgi:hypothetical protein